MCEREGRDTQIVLQLATTRCLHHMCLLRCAMLCVHRAAGILHDGLCRLYSPDKRMALQRPLTAALGLFVCIAPQASFMADGATTPVPTSLACLGPLLALLVDLDLETHALMRPRFIILHRRHPSWRTGPPCPSPPFWAAWPPRGALSRWCWAFQCRWRRSTLLPSRRSASSPPPSVRCSMALHELESVTFRSWRLVVTCSPPAASNQGGTALVAL